MKFMSLIALGVLGLSGCENASMGGGSGSLDTFADSASYAVGRAMAASGTQMPPKRCTRHNAVGVVGGDELGVAALSQRA